MKRLLLLILTAILTFGLVACGSDTTSISGDNNEEPTEEVKEEDSQANKEESQEKDEDVQEDNDLKVTNTYSNKELGITGTAGPMKYEISAIQLKKIEPKNQETADLFDVSVGDTVHAFTIEMAGENTSDEDMSFYLGQALAITNTKEQLEPDMLMSEHIEGEYLGEVRHEGHNVYILKNSTVDELETIELRISAPSDSNWESVGDDIKHVIEVNN